MLLNKLGLFNNSFLNHLTQYDFKHKIKEHY